jgi:hypothetical protein
MFTYGRTSEEFENISLQERLVMAKQWLGYSMTQEPDLNQASVISKIKGLFVDHETLILKYPEGAPDILMKLKYMSNDEKSKYLSEFSKRIIRISLHHSLMPGHSLIRLSLKDSIVDRQLTAQEISQKENAEKQDQDLMFWKNIIKEFNKDEVAPF